MISQLILSSGSKVWRVALVPMLLLTMLGEPVQGGTKRSSRRASRPIARPLGLSPVLQGQTTWKNQRGSTLVLINDGKGNLTGQYATAVGCHPNVPRKLVGTINGTAITFIVNWEECGSVTAWSGSLDSAGDPKEITTLWLLTVGESPSSPANFKSTYAGSDTFTKTK